MAWHVQMIDLGKRDQHRALIRAMPCLVAPRVPSHHVPSGASCRLFPVSTRVSYGPDSLNMRSMSQLQFIRNAHPRRFQQCPRHSVYGHIQDEFGVVLARASDIL